MDQADDNETVVFTKKELREMVDTLRKISRETDMVGHDYGMPAVASASRKMTGYLLRRIEGQD